MTSNNTISIIQAFRFTPFRQNTDNWFYADSLSIFWQYAKVFKCNKIVLLDREHQMVIYPELNTINRDHPYPDFPKFNPV